MFLPPLEALWGQAASGLCLLLCTGKQIPLGTPTSS
jgi:hypothetical protein